MTETWKDINANYRVSDLGRVYNKKQNRYNNVTIRKDGYCKTTINYKTTYLHRLIATAFIPNPENKPQVAHLNGDTTDNRACNLEWATAKENCDMKKQHGTYQIGSKNGYSKLTEEDILQIREDLSNNVNRKDITRRYGITNTTISDIKKGKTWKHV